METFPALLERLYREQYTGPVTVQFGQGVPIVAEFPQAPVRLRLDRSPRVRPDLTLSVTIAP